MITPSVNRILVVIPARYGSTRLPGKPLLDLEGKPMIQRTFESVTRSTSAGEIVVATDDERIKNAVEAFGGCAAMTSSRHRSGTERVAEVATDRDAEVIVNVQGDEPLLEPEMIDRVCEVLHENPETPMATLAAPIEDEADFLNPDIVKVVLNKRGWALTFSRAPIPFMRNGFIPGLALGHMGIYAYRKEFLLAYPKLEETPLERSERLEQLRVLEYGFHISVGIVLARTLGVDTEEDLAQVRDILKDGNSS